MISLTGNQREKRRRENQENGGDPVDSDTCRNSGTNGGRGTASCGCNTGALIPTLPPSSSSALGANSLLFSPFRNRLIVLAFCVRIQSDIVVQ